MTEIIVMLIFLFFSVLGAGCFTYRVWMFLIKPKKKSNDLIVAKLENGHEKEQFMYYFEKYRWCGEEYANTLIMVVENNRDKMFSSFCNVHKNIICCTDDELPYIIKKVLEG